MYLKGIEVSGFKSFARKTEFRFEDGITGIVGPNGSGKSNVADAMRWVLGEQSAKQLRSTSMQDVIFAGTENRRAQGYAYVNIIFDNTDHTLPIDYDEVTIGRRVYRSGESEYLINSNSCRLKDVQELLFDTGIGKEGYSIIGQGQIDKILSGKPEDRRELFDEAAGIMKYKKRRKETVRRLEKEEESLVRINDILAELTRQEGPLKRQSEKARVYLKLHDRLRICDANEFLLDSEDSRLKLEDAEKNLGIASGQLESLRGELSGVRERYDELEEIIAGQDEAIQEAREQLDATRNRINVLERDAAVLRGQMEADEKTEKLYLSQKEQLEKQYETAEREYADLEKSFDKLCQERDAYEHYLKELSDRQEKLSERIAENDKQTRESTGEKDELTGRKSDLLVNKQKYDTMSEQSQLREASLNGQIMEAQGEKEEAEESLKKGKKEMKQAETDIADLKAQIRTAQDARTSAQEELNRCRKASDIAAGNLHQAKARYDSLANVAERYEGYGNSVRRIMENKNRFPGVHGALADLLHVEKRYETAIETALGGALQNIVADDEKTAKACIEYLKQNKAGKATFLPITTVHPRGSFGYDQAFQMQGVCNTADQLVSADEQYYDIIASLLGRILVVDTMDHALAIEKKFHYAFRIVTLDGESLNIGGSISGGAYKNNSNLLGRRRELEELEQKTQRAAAAMEKAKTETELAQLALERCSTDLDNLRRKMQEAQVSFSQIEMRLRQSLDQRDAASDRLQALKDSLEALHTEQGHLKEDYQQAEATATDVEDKIEKLNLSLTELENERRKMEEEASRLADRSVELQVSQTSIMERCNHTETDLARILLDQDDKMQQIGILKDQIEELQKKKDTSKKQLEDIHAEQEEKDLDQKKQEKEIENLTAKRNDSDKERSKLFGSQEELSGQIGELEKEHMRLEHQKESLEENLARKAEHLLTEYDMEPGDAANFRMEEMPSHSQLKEEIRDLRSQIRGLGNVNTGAVEEYDELVERLTFMRSQQEDLVHARENLQKLIEQLNNGMRQQFNEKFAEIQKEFDKVFKELFGGGYGTLELEETGEDMLETGILINVQPPGKKLQNMMQLSGGEKALTAISLLFAIQNLKPSPFCMLDEIEAALDDVNVDRFAEYLNKLKKNTQFIVITHRRGTMLIADQLYGITMQEKGISSLVSVDLTDADQA